MSTDAFLVVAFALGYLLGSIPFGLVLTKVAGTQDLRSIGSGNIGATNVLRTGRKGLAAATLVCDALKGTIAVVALSPDRGLCHAAVSVVVRPCHTGIAVRRADLDAVL